MTFSQEEIESIIWNKKRFTQQSDIPGFINIPLAYEFDNKHLILLCVNGENEDDIKKVIDVWGEGGLLIITESPNTPEQIYAVYDLIVRSYYCNGKLRTPKKKYRFIDLLRIYVRKNNIVKINDI